MKLYSILGDRYILALGEVKYWGDRYILALGEVMYWGGKYILALGEFQGGFSQFQCCFLPVCYHSRHAWFLELISDKTTI